MEVKYVLKIDGGFVREWDIAQIEDAGSMFALTKMDNPDSLVELARIEEDVVMTSKARVRACDL
jgi:hypothetical protein